MTIRVLLADDHIMVRDALAALVAAQGDMAVVAVASDGREATLKARALCPDVALLDLSMPQMNGIEAAAQIRRLVPGCRIIALSALGDDCFISQVVAAGAHGYVHKSESGQRLIETLRRVHAGERCVPEVATPLPKPGQTLLSAREREVLGRLASGARGSQIAQEMGVAVKTVDTYRRRMMQKLGLRSQSELVRYAMALGEPSRSGPSSQ